MRSLFLASLLAILFVSCGGNQTDTSAATEEVAAEEPAPPAITIGDMSESPAFPDAKITGMTYEAGKFSFAVDGGEGYSLGAQTPDAPTKMCANSGKGQHIHLIIDNEPYAAKYEADFEYEVADGEHYLLAFLSRSYHESLKHADAAKAVKVNVADKAITEMADIDQPMLFYSRPKGKYVGEDTKNIMLDFYPVNVELGEKYKVIAIVGDQKFEIDEWKPYVLNNLPMGENTVTLTLVDSEGNNVDTPLNPVSRTFTLAAE